MNPLEKVVHTGRDLDAAVHTALLHTAPHPEQLHGEGLNVSAIGIWRTPAGREASTRPVAHVRGYDSGSPWTTSVPSPPPS